MTIALTELNTLAQPRFVSQLADIFEHSPWVAEAVAGARPFSSIGVLHDTMVATVRAAPVERQDALIRAHPDLAGKAAKAGSLTAASTSEQAGAGLDRMTDAQYDQFDALNGTYRERFGMPFIIAVRGQGVEDILNAFRRRLLNDREAERMAALEQIARIARLRLDDLIEEGPTGTGRKNGEAKWDA